MADDRVVHMMGVCKGYHSGGAAVQVLADVDLSVSRGECLFLAGPSGSGKTTLLSILGCVLSADAGRVTILGEEVTQYSEQQQARFRREKIGFVFQRFHLFDALTAAENIAIPLTLLQWPKSDARAEARKLLALLGLADKADCKITQLSMGQRQRIAVARALAGNPELILADEPTASLDAESGIAAMLLLKELCSKLAKTVIVVTHDARIFPLADRVLLLSHGRLENACSLEKPPRNRTALLTPLIADRLSGRAT